MILIFIKNKEIIDKIAVSVLKSEIGGYMLSIIFSIVALLMGALTFIMFSQPLFWAYGEGADGANEIWKRGSLYDAISFQEGQNALLTVGAVLLIIALVMAGVMMLLTIINMIGRASSKKAKVGAKVAALLFFLVMLAASIIYVVYSVENLNSFSEFTDIVVTIGYGLIISLGASFIALIFAPRKKK